VWEKPILSIVSLTFLLSTGAGLGFGCGWGRGLGFGWFFSSETSGAIIDIDWYKISNSGYTSRKPFSDMFPSLISFTSRAEIPAEKRFFIEIVTHRSSVKCS